MWDVRDVGCWGCGMFGMWNVRDVGCGVFARMWDVDLQNAIKESQVSKRMIRRTLQRLVYSYEQ